MAAVIRGIPWFYGALWHGQADAEKALLMRDYLRSVNRTVPFKFELPGALSPIAQEAYRAFGDLDKKPGDTSVRDAVYKVFEADLRTKGMWVPNIAEGGKLSWIRNPSIPTEKAALCASWMLEQEGQGPLRVSALRRFLTERVGRPISNPAAEINALSLHHPSLVEYLTRSKGRAGITYKVTADGATMAKELQDEFATDEEDESGSDT